MRRRTQQFAAAFAIGLIVVGALCGFVLVDVSTERYMPEQHKPLFLVRAVGEEGIRFSALGQGYEIDAAQFEPARDWIWRLRGLLPGSVNLTGSLVTRGYVRGREALESRQEPEEPW